MDWLLLVSAFIIHIQLTYSHEYLLRLKSNAPAIKGSMVTFTADLLETNGSFASVGDTLKWDWLIDDHEKQSSKEFRTSVPHVEWTYQFPKHSNKNSNKTYKLNVSVGQWYIFFSYPLASNSMEINITATLNGEMKLTQSGHVVRPYNVSTAVALEQRLDIRLGDLDSIKNATSTVTHWFIDCQYVRETKDMKLQHIFNEPNRTHHIDALIEASFEPIPIKPVPTLKSKLISNWRTQHKADLPFICHNRSKITPDPNKVYGHFEANVTVYDPISDLIVNGSAWINDGADYQLNIFCNGSPNFEYCIRHIDGPYIMDGQETCEKWSTMDVCQQNLEYAQSVLNVKSFTVLVIVRNAVSIERKLFVVNIKQPIIFVATMVGALVFTLCIIGVVACCIVRCIRKKRRISKKPMRSDAESSLMGHNQNKLNDTKHISTKNHS